MKIISKVQELNVIQLQEHFRRMYVEKIISSRRQ